MRCSSARMAASGTILTNAGPGGDDSCCGSRSYPPRAIAQGAHPLPSMRKLPLLIASLALTACGGHDASSNASANGGTVIIAAPGDAETIFPPHVVNQVGAAIRDQVYDRLADLGDSLNTIGDAGFTPHLADRWEWSRDSLSVTFHLDP